MQRLLLKPSPSLFCLCFIVRGVGKGKIMVRAKHIGLSPDSGISKAVNTNGLDLMGFFKDCKRHAPLWRRIPRVKPPRPAPAISTFGLLLS